MEAGRTPERIELENYRRSSKEEAEEEEEELQEISEEDLNHFNLREEEDTHTHSSSESEMEEEEEEENSREEQEEDSEEDEEEGGSDVESSEEGEYSPWEVERTSGLWLLLQEETEEEVSLVSSAAESDVTPASSGSAPFLTFPRTSPVTPPPARTPSTETTTPGSTPCASLPGLDEERWREVAPTVVVMETKRGASDEFKAAQERKGAGSDEEEGSRRRRRGAHTLPPRLLPPLQAGGGALWRAVFSGHRKKKRRGGASLPGGEKLKKEAANARRTTALRRGLTRTEESDLDSTTMLQRCSLTPRCNLRLELFDLTAQIHRVSIKEEEEEDYKPTYVPHALAFKRAYAIKRQKDRVQDSFPTEVQPKESSSLGVTDTMFQKGQESEDENLDARITRRVQRAARRQAKQEELKRLHKAQMIQRQLQQVEEKQRQLEERGVMVEKALRGEADFWENSDDNTEMDLHLGGLGKVDNPALMQQWFQLVQQKNALVRYESELIIFARELQLEDRQSRLQQELRERMAVDDHLKEEAELLAERLILEEMLDVVEQRDSLVSLLEEQRLQERQEDQDLEAVMVSRELGLNWT